MVHPTRVGVLHHVLYKNLICCHLSGIFVSYIAQVFDKHESICLYVAKHDAPILTILFQGGGSADFIDLEGFQLELVRRDFVWVTVRYTLTFGAFVAQITVIGINCPLRA